MLEIEPLRVGSQVRHIATDITWEVIKVYDDGDVALKSGLGTYTKENKYGIARYYTKVKASERMVKHGVV